MTLTPAYGRDYNSAKAAIADFEAGKDFIANDFQKSGAFNINEMTTPSFRRSSTYWRLTCATTRMTA